MLCRGPRKALINSRLKGGLFKRKQWKILELRARGFTQSDIAKKFGTSRANISMIEFRAKKKLNKARETIKAYESLQFSHMASINKGTKLAEIPLMILHEGDKRHIHINSDIIEIVQLVKALRPAVVREGKILRGLEFRINESGKLEVSN
jgi:HTH-type transcriptional regulator, fmd operon transcriptional regulator